MDVNVILREIAASESRLESQMSLLESTQEVLDKATETGSVALARIAKLRLRRHSDAVADTRKVLAELKALLPPPPPQLPLSTEISAPPKPGKAR